MGLPSTVATGAEVSAVVTPLLGWQAARAPMAARKRMRECFILTLSGDRKSTCLNSSHSQISYAGFCLKKKRTDIPCAVHLNKANHIGPFSHLDVPNTQQQQPVPPSSSSSSIRLSKVAEIRKRTTSTTT